VYPPVTDPTPTPPTVPLVTGTTPAKSWLSGIKWSGLALLGIAVVLVAIQWFKSPIAIETLTVDANTTSWGIAGDAIADEIKSRITEINAESGELFRGRKLGAATVPLDVKIGDWDVTVEKLTKALGVRLTSAHVTGHLSKVDQCIVLETATSMGDEVRVDVFQIDAPPGDTRPVAKKKPCTDLPSMASGTPVVDVTAKRSGVPSTALLETIKRPAAPPAPPSPSLLEAVDSRIQCVALRVMVVVSPDVAANYLFKRAEGEENRPPDPDIPRRCEVPDDVRLYAQVAEDHGRDPAERANALVGLSLVYLRSHEIYEAVNLADAATDLLERAKNCDQWAPDSAWQRFRCRVRRQSGAATRAEIAAWMQRGQATAVYAMLASDATMQNERRGEAIKAFEHVVALEPGYALAYDAIGLQEEARGDSHAARDSSRLSVSTGETPAAHYDLGWLYVYRRNDFVGEDYWAEAEHHFRAAIRLQPDYWDAHRGLGYVLFENEQYRQAIDVLKPAADHETNDGELYRHLGSAYAGICQFDKARREFKAAYAVYAASRQALAGVATIEDEAHWKAAGDNQHNTLTDWGKVLNHFGLHTAAIAQEQAVVRAAPDHIYAMESLGQFQTKAQDKRVQALGIANLKRAFDADADKHDFVLADYLNGLTETGHADQAIQFYEEWGQKGLVPLPVGSGPIRPSGEPNQSVRLSYAVALRTAGRWKAALDEFKEVRRLNIEFTRKAIGDLQDQAAQGGADDAQIQNAQALEAAAVPNYDPHDCPNAGIPESTPRMPPSTPLGRVSIL
jgi:tetratricopeptide (TPR) repeat protein